MPDKMPEPDVRLPVIDRGPRGVLHALAGADPGFTVDDALAQQRETFRAAIGCYPDELVEVDPAGNPGI